MKYSPPLTCPCVKAEKPMCREGRNCWHFGNTNGTCDQCHCTGSVVPSTPFAAFIRNGTPKEKAEVYGRVMGKASEMQRATIDKAHAANSSAL